MKKWAFLLPLFLCGCMPSPTIRDAACAKIETVHVVRVTDDMILGWTDRGGNMDLYSPSTFYHASDEHYVYLKREPYQIYYPGQVLHLPDEECIKYGGTFDYNLGERYGSRTLKGVVDQAEYPNPEYEALMAERYEKAKTSCWMRRRLGQQCNKK